MRTLDTILIKIKEDYITDVSKIEFLLRENNLIKTKEDMLNFIKISINQNVQIHEVIEKYLINYAMPNKLYFDIIIMLAKNRNSFVILQNLNKLHKQNAKIATWLCQELIKTSDLDIAYVLGYLYNGIYEKNLDDFFDKVDGKLTDIEKIGFLCTVEIFFSSNQNIPKTIHKFIISLSESESNQLKNFAVRCLVRIGLSDYDIKTHLLRIVKTCNDTIKSEMIVYLTSMNKNEKKFTVKLLKELSDTNNKKLKKEIDQKFTELISHNAIEYLKIIKKWSECKDFGNNYHEYRTIDLLGDGDLNTIHSFMIMWIQCENNYRKTPCLSNVISRIYINKIDDLIKLLNALNYKKQKIFKLILKILQLILENYFDNGFTPKRIGEFAKIIDSMIKYNGNIWDKDKYNFIKNESEFKNNSVLLLLFKLDEIQKDMKIPELQKMKISLNKFPNINRFFGKDNLVKLFNNKPHNMLIVKLSQIEYCISETQKIKRKIYRTDNKIVVNELKLKLDKEERRLRYSFAIIKEIDTVLSKFKNNDQGTRMIRNDFQDNMKLYDVLTGLEVASRLKQKFETNLEPKYENGRRGDIETTVENTKIIFEIITPKQDLRTEYTRTVHEIKNKITSKIVDKLNEQLHDLRDLKIPVIIIIDNNNYMDDPQLIFMELFVGSPGIEIKYNKNDHKIDSRMINMKDSIYDKTMNVDVLSGIIVVSRVYLDNQIKINGNIFSNPHAIIPLDEKIIENIQKIIFT